MKKILLSGLLCSALFADFTLEYQMDGNAKQIVQYKDAQHIRVTTKVAQGGESGAQLIVGDKKYMVVNDHGKKRYMDMDVMIQQMKQMQGMMGGAQQADAGEPEPEFKIVKKGAKKKVAGIDAEVWTIEATVDGHKERMNVTVTKDENVVDAVHKYTDAMKTLSGMDERGQESLGKIMNISKGYVAIAFDGMKLVKYDASDIPDTLFALPPGVNMGDKLQIGKQSTAVKKPPLCPIVGAHGKAKQLDAMTKESVQGWKRIESASCGSMMKMGIENAIYQKGDTYIHLSLSVNVHGESGMIAKYRTSNMKISGLKRGKIEGMHYQSAFLERIGQSAMDIKLPNAMLTLTATQNAKVDFPEFAKAALDLKKFVPVKKSKPSADDALKSLGEMFGGHGGSHHSSGQSSQADMQKAAEMMKGLFGK